MHCSSPGLQGHFYECDVEPSYALMQTCVDSTGTHAATFWTYFALRAVYQATMNNVYALLDGTGLRQAKEYNSDYTYIMFFTSLGVTISPLIAGAVIKDPEVEGGKCIRTVRRIPSASSRSDPGVRGPQIQLLSSFVGGGGGD